MNSRQAQKRFAARHLQTYAENHGAAQLRRRRQFLGLIGGISAAFVGGLGVLIPEAKAFRRRSAEVNLMGEAPAEIGDWKFTRLDVSRTKALLVDYSDDTVSNLLAHAPGPVTEKRVAMLRGQRAENPNLDVQGQRVGFVSEHSARLYANASQPELLGAVVISGFLRFSDRGQEQEFPFGLAVFPNGSVYGMYEGHVRRAEDRKLERRLANSFFPKDYAARMPAVQVATQKDCEDDCDQQVCGDDECHIYGLPMGARCMGATCAFPAEDPEAEYTGCSILECWGFMPEDIDPDDPPPFIDTRPDDLPVPEIIDLSGVPQLGRVHPAGLINAHVACSTPCTAGLFALIVLIGVAIVALILTAIVFPAGLPAAISGTLVAVRIAGFICLAWFGTSCITCQYSTRYNNFVIWSNYIQQRYRNGILVPC